MDGETDSVAVAKAEQAVLLAIQKVETTILTPADRALRLGMLASQPAVNTAAKIAQLLDVFNILLEEMSIDELAGQTKSRPGLATPTDAVARGIQFLHPDSCKPLSAYLIAFSRKLAEGPAGNWIKICDDIGQAMSRGMVPALIRTGFQNPKDPSGSGAVEVWGQPLFQYLAKEPRKAAEFGLAIEVQSELDPAYYAHFPLSEAKYELSKLPDAAHTSRYNPELRGRFIVQDLLVVVDELKLHDVPFELMAQDFFKPQTLTDVEILASRRLRNACITTNNLHATRSYSRILIQEFVLSDVNCGQREAIFDIIKPISVFGYRSSTYSSVTLIPKQDDGLARNGKV
ncbi:hypothetical protein PV04_06581 [Phialophora macrospora]|uniref:Uncharacterized protein n=1 Tax=Phialophora macrospora TaxID=1851006 RepID=A0A0D2DYW2_9EURO|nr:hypothetical protein PV04_06581 [Phialophora macrospora]